jgi:2-alkyl-3-oxoalkanoate reductase
MKYQKILVTGAGGFLGGRMVEALLKEADEVVANARNDQRKAYLEGLGARFALADLCDAAAVDEMVAGCDLIVHCAAKSSPWGNYRSFYEANVVATENLLKAAKKSGQVKRFIHISTPSIYFNYKHRLNILESDPLPKQSVNAYAATKLISEQRVFAAEVPAISLRPRAIIGKGDTIIMPRLLKAYQENRLYQIGPRNALVSITPALNVIEAVRQAMYAESNALGKAYNITSGEEIKLWDMVRLVLQTLNLSSDLRSMPYFMASQAAGMMEWYANTFSHKEPTLTRYSVGTLYYDMTLDITLAREQLGFQPVQSVEEGIEEFAQWWRTENNRAS